MRYERILRAAAAELWAIEPTKGRAIAEFLAMAAAGETKRRNWRPWTNEERAMEAAAIPGQTARSIRNQPGALAVIPLMGVMALRASLLDDISAPPPASSEAIGRMVDAAAADPEVKAILLHVDSPGGSVSGTPELAAKVRAAREVKPVIAQVNAFAASGAYWIASQATEVVVTPSGDVGSIGVYILHEDISQALEDVGFKETFIFAGKYKVEGNPFEPLGDEAREHLQDRVNEAYSMFVRDVAAGRGVSVDAVRKDFGQGRLVSAQAAVAAGMADRVATLDETIARYAGEEPPRDGRRSRRRAQVATLQLK